MTSSRTPLLTRFSSALRVLRGDAQNEEARAIIGTTYPNFPAGSQQMTLVRTANPQEYKPSGATIRTLGFDTHPVVHACIRVIADIVASVPLVVLNERGNSESRVDPNHPLQRLLDYPGPRMTARQMRLRYAVDYLGYGNAFFQIDRPGPNSQPVGLRSVNAESIQSVWVDIDGDPRRYDYGNWSGIIVQVPAEDMIHFRDMDMPKPFQPDVFGYPRGATAIASMAADQEATKYVRQIVTNDGTPTFAVLMSDEATTDDAQAMQDRYRARVVDRGKRGTPAFFGAVKDIKPLGFTLADLEFPDLRRVSREDICAAFGVDPRIIGIGSATRDAGLSGAQYIEARSRLVQHTIEPMLSAIEDELNHWLAPEFGDVWVTYDHDTLRDLVEDDEATSTRIRAEFKDSLRTWEESRRALKLPPTPLPQEAIALSTGTQLVPAAVVVVDPTVMAEQVATDNEQPGSPAGGLVNEEEMDEDEEKEDEEEGEDEDLPASRSELAAVPAEMAPVVDADWWEMMSPEELAADARFQFYARAIEMLDRNENRFYDRAMMRFVTERADVGEMFGVNDRAYTTAAEILAEIERRVRQDYAPGGNYYEAWRKAFLDLIGEMYMAGSSQITGSAALAFNMQSSPVLAAIESRAATLADLVGQTTATEILAAIRAGEVAALSVAEIGKLVQASVFSQTVTDNRAKTIARTESAGAMAQGNWDQAQELGIYQSKEWLAFQDKRTRPTHTACMRQGRLAVDAAFTNGLQYPHERGKPADEVINCRCILMFFQEPVEEA